MERRTGRLRQLQSIGDVRNLGAMVAMELVVDGDDNPPDPELTAAIVSEAAKTAPRKLYDCHVHPVRLLTYRLGIIRSPPELRPPNPPPVTPAPKVRLVRPSAQRTRGFQAWRLPRLDAWLHHM